MRQAAFRRGSYRVRVESGEHFEPAIGHAPQSAAVGVATGTHLRICLFTGRVPDHAGACPVVESITQPLIGAAAAGGPLIFWQRQSFRTVARSSRSLR